MATPVWNARDDTTEEFIREEIHLHRSDPLYGSPMQLGVITLAMHAADCPRCAFLIKQEIERKMAK